MRKTTSALLGAAIIASLGTGCSFQDTVAEPDSAGVATKLPEDTDKAKSVKQAEEFKAWLDKHGSGSQKDAGGRVQKIIGEWDDKTGTAFISTDINGGTTPVKDGMATAEAIAIAFNAYAETEQGRVSIYDVFGNALITNAKF